MGIDAVNPCLTCGACCAVYRVSFYWAEADDCTENGVPVELTQQLTPFRRSMRTIGGPGESRCIALMGIIGSRVFCSVYANRSSVCRDFDAAWLNGGANERCDAARALCQLPPLTPQEWDDAPDLHPKAA